MSRLPLDVACAAIGAALFLTNAPPVGGGTLEWVRQFGTESPDEALSVSADSLGNVYISGLTLGSLGGPNAGGVYPGGDYSPNPFASLDPFLAKYDAAGSLQWIRQLGTPGYGPRYDEQGTGVSADGLGNVYITGYTGGSLGGPHAGLDDAWLAKYDAAGDQLWIRQLGTDRDDRSNGVSADGLGNVYISGYTAGDLGAGRLHGGDAFVTKYDAAGNLQWTRQLGIPPQVGFIVISYEDSTGVSADGLGNVYITGITDGNLAGSHAGWSSLGSYDAFVAKYDAAGNHEWTRQLGTSAWDYPYGVSADARGNVYIAGDTRGSLGGPSAGGVADAFVAKYDAAGDLAWIRQFGTSFNDRIEGVSTDGLGNVYVVGLTGDNLGGPSAGGRDAFVAKYDAAGDLQWLRQFGVRAWDEAHGVSVDGLGNVYVGGHTEGGSLGGPNAGSSDAWVAKFVDVEPSPGDFNADGVVDGSDFLAWQRGLGTFYTADDLQTWKSNFGAPAAGAAAGAPGQGAVPEPAALPLVLTAALAAGMARRRACVSERLGRAGTPRRGGRCARLSAPRQSLVGGCSPAAWRTRLKLTRPARLSCSFSTVARPDGVSPCMSNMS